MSYNEPSEHFGDILEAVSNLRLRPTTLLALKYALRGVLGNLYDNGLSRDQYEQLYERITEVCQ